MTWNWLTQATYISEFWQHRETQRPRAGRREVSVEGTEAKSSGSPANFQAVPGLGDIDARIEGAAGVITLNRPRALNALNTAMRTRISESFTAWSRDPQVYAVVIASATDRAFCAGGDVREMVEWAKSSPAAAIAAVGAEYSLNWQIDCFTKPTVSLIDGVVMGAGVGLSLYGTHRVAGERYRFAMPETAIGLFPDDGACWAFAQMPDEIGMYLALTGRSIGRADAYRLGLVTHCIPAARFAEIRSALIDAEPVDPVLDAWHMQPEEGELGAHRSAIARCFGAQDVEGILSRLQAERGDAQAWAQEVISGLATRSPTSLKITFRHVREAKAHDLQQTLAHDFRLAVRCMERHDFAEGVRASLIDRDRNPRWQPGRLEDVTEADVESYFAPLDRGELELASRAEMQAPRP
jgi:enoyl-CoA hydratase